MGKVFGKIVWDKRKELIITRWDLADKLNKSANYIASIEYGHRLPASQETYKKLANALEINVNKLKIAAYEDLGIPVLVGNDLDEANEIGLSIMKRWPDLDIWQLKHIVNILDSNKQNCMLCKKIVSVSELCEDGMCSHCSKAS